MIQINPRYEVIFDMENIDQDCDRIAGLMSDEGEFIKEALDAGLYKQAVTMYLQLLKSMCEHFIEDEHWCYFDDMYSPEYTMQWIYEAIRKAAIKREEGQVTTCAFPSASRLNEIKHVIDEGSRELLEEGHKEILQSECYKEYGYPSYIDRI